jgi:hypothetical protein
MSKKSKAASAEGTTGKPIRMGRITYLGSAPATDPIYTGGWNFLSSKFLNPRSRQQSEESSQQPRSPPKGRKGR